MFLKVSSCDVLADIQTHVPSDLLHGSQPLACSSGQVDFYACVSAIVPVLVVYFSYKFEHFCL